MLLFNQMKSVREQNIPVAEWSSRIDPGIDRARPRPMAPVTRNNESSPYAVKTMTTADENFANWIRDIGAPDQQSELATRQATQETEAVAVHEPKKADSTPRMPVPEKRKPSPDQTATLLPEEGLSRTGFHSVNSAEHRLDSAHHHLQTMGLAPDSTWPQIISRYHETMAKLKTSPQALPGQAAEVERRRRAINTAYACLRLLAGR